MIFCFGSNKLNCSIPLAFFGRYFILEQDGNIPLISVVSEYREVVLEQKGKPVFEVFRNEPCTNPLTTATKTTPGIITVSDLNTNKFLYKIRPSSETSIIFGKIKDEETETEIVITDQYTLVNGNKFSNNSVTGFDVGFTILKNGFILGSSLPEFLRPLLATL